MKTTGIRPGDLDLAATACRIVAKDLTDTIRESGDIIARDGHEGYLANSAKTWLAIADRLEATARHEEELNS